MKNLHDIRDLKQTATAASTTEDVDEESWAEYVTVDRQISTLNNRRPDLKRTGKIRLGQDLCLTTLYPH